MPHGDKLERRWYKQDYRARLRAEGKLPPLRPRPGRKRTPKLKPFRGVDGEGCGKNRNGQQHYMLLRAGPHELYTGKRLTTLQCLDFICSLPNDHTLVGFGFGYDATQILRDLPPDRVARLFADNPMGQGRSRYTYFNNFGIEYLPKNYLRVCRVVRGHAFLPSGRMVPTVQKVEGTTRTIWETLGNFQMSFLKALQAFDVGREHWPMLERNKQARGSFVRITREIRRYNQLECELLAELMERFRALCHDAEIHPSSWSGAGKLASYLHGKYHTITADEIARRVPDGVLSMTKDAYFGGRFEVSRIGAIERPVFEYDIASAYPAAMLTLPCLLHGTWREVTPLWLDNAPDNAVFVARVQFNHPDEGQLFCGLPIREKNGHLHWPRQGGGTYWSEEIRSAQRRGAKITYLGGWRYTQVCQCQACDFVQPLFDRRRALGKDMQGYPIKLGLNSLYGKLAQRIGNPRFGNLIWAGLITATTRAKLNDAIGLDPAQIVMVATDAVFSLRKLSLDFGDGLGQWEHDPAKHEHPRFFVVQPGLYWGLKKAKTRGVPLSQFARHKGRFERTWAKFAAGHPVSVIPPGLERMAMTLLPATLNGIAPERKLIPAVAIRLNLFIGLRLAASRGKLGTAGIWDDQPREISFDWHRKRSLDGVQWDGDCVVTQPRLGAPDRVSVSYDGSVDRTSPFDLGRAELEEQPDHVDLSPP